MPHNDDLGSENLPTDPNLPPEDSAINSNSTNIWVDDNMKNMTSEEIEKSFFGLDYLDEESVKKIVDFDKKEIISPDFDLSDFEENITKDDIVAEGIKHSNPTK